LGTESIVSYIEIAFQGHQKVLKKQNGDVCLVWLKFYVGNVMLETKAAFVFSKLKTFQNESLTNSYCSIKTWSN